MDSYGAIQVMNTSKAACRILRNLTVRTRGEGTMPRLTSIRGDVSHEPAILNPGTALWAATDTVADNLLHPRGCTSATQVEVHLEGMWPPIAIPVSSLHGKSRLILHFCHVRMTVGPLRSASRGRETPGEQSPHPYSDQR
jgi:hypothetical protein